MDENQIFVPPSFVAIYSDARGRLTSSMALVRERSELCEDLAQQMVEHGGAMYHRLGISEDEVLTRCRAGLLSPDSGLSAGEAEWVVSRLAELLGWPWPPAA